MKTIIFKISVFALLFSGCESESISKSESISIYAEKIVGKWRLSETLEVREFTDDGLAFVYNIEEGRGELFQYFDVDESHIRFYAEESLSGESWGFPYQKNYDSIGTEHLILTVIHPEGQGVVDCDYYRIE
jgi:hypothetical protein